MKQILSIVLCAGIFMLVSSFTFKKMIESPEVANFYKTESKSTNAHYITRAVVDNPPPKFHLPEFFGTLEFK